MSVFKRADWHSGLTYRRTCDQCKTLVEYKDDKLDFRPWFADGFVYCPTCKKPLRHNESFAIFASEKKAAEPSEELAAFCVKCGKKFGDGDVFCSGCGNKR